MEPSDLERLAPGQARSPADHERWLAHLARSTKVYEKRDRQWGWIEPLARDYYKRDDPDEGGTSPSEPEPEPPVSPMGETPPDPVSPIGETPPEEPWHGTPGGYTNHECRCERCTAAHTAAKTHADRRKAFARDGLALIELETNTVPGDVDPRSHPTVGDFVRCKPRETYSCIRGGYWTHDRLSTEKAGARIRHGHGACGTVCEHCSPWWASERLKILAGMLHATADGPHVVEMLRHEWDGPRGAEIREDYTADPVEEGKRRTPFYSVWYQHDFEHIAVLTPGPTEGSRPVSGREVAEIILASPGQTDGRHRYFGASLSRPRKPSEWKSYHFPGWAGRDVSETIEFKLGKTFREDDESDTWPIHTASKSILGATDEDVLRHRRTVAEIRASYAEDEEWQSEWAERVKVA